MSALSAGDANHALVRAFDEATESFKMLPTGQQIITQAPSGATATVYGTDSIASGATSILVDYTVGPGNDKYAQRIYFSGGQVGSAIVYKNGNIIFKLRLSPAIFTQVVELSTNSAFGVKLITGDNITIEAENNGTSVGDFDTTLQVMET